MSSEERNNTQEVIGEPQGAEETPVRTLLESAEVTASVEGEAALEIPPEKALEERVAVMETELLEARGQAEEYLDQWRRTAAEFANYRKRQERDQAEFTKQAGAALITRLLPILDDFDLAFEHLTAEPVNDTWVEGFALIRRKLQTILEQEGVSLIESVGQPFDPTLHEAVTYEEGGGVESGRVIAELRKGYRLGDRVLRPAMVRVAR